MPFDGALEVQERFAGRVSAGGRVSIGVSDAAAAAFRWLDDWSLRPSEVQAKDIHLKADQPEAALNRRQRRARRLRIRTTLRIGSPKSCEEQIFDRLAAFKILISRVSMYIDEDWKNGIFKQLDLLLNVETWPAETDLPTEASFSTFLKFAIHLRPKKRPSFGVGNGNLIATWREGDASLFVDFQRGDEIRWAATQVVRDRREAVAGQCPISRLVPNLAAYHPQRWFASE